MQGIAVDNYLNADYLALEKLIPENHFLRKVRNKIDFSFVNRLTESCYSPNNGRPSIPPELYFKMILIGYLYGIRSIRRLVEDIRYNISYRWFCGLTLQDSVPDHASLSRVKKRYSVQIFENFFQKILGQCQKADLLNGHFVMTDSTLFQANASLNSMKPLASNKQESVEIKQPGISLSKINISNKTHQSTTDPDATLAFKAGTTRTLKYKAHLCCDSTSRLIVAIKITTGAVHDSKPYLEMMDYLKTRSGLVVHEAIADRAYGVGHIIASLERDGIKNFIPLFNTRSGTAYSTPADFHYDSERNVYICPAQKELKPGKIYPEDYMIYFSSTKDCRNCLLKDSCQATRKKGREIRAIVRHVHFDLFQKVLKEMETDLFKTKLSERLWKIEGVMNELKNYHCMFKAIYRGLENVQIQAYMAAIAINIKRLVFLFLILFQYNRLIFNQLLQQAASFFGIP